MASLKDKCIFMAIVNKSAIVPYSAAQMYDLVNDVEKYSQFVPYCAESKIVERAEDQVHARLTFAGAGIDKSFTTLNRLQPHRMIEMRLVDGPFKQLEGFWSFESLEENTCRVTLNLEFEFSTTMLRLLFGPVFNQVAMMLVEAFQNRAKQVY